MSAQQSLPPGQKPGDCQPFTLNRALSGAIFQPYWLELLFSYRNQEYGAYQLRQQYNRRMTWAGLLTIALVFFAYFGTVFAKKIMADDEDLKYTIYDMTPPPLEDKATPPPPPPVTPPPPPQQATITFVVPKPTPDDLVAEEEIPPTQEEMKDLAIGTKTIDGDPNGVPEGLLDAPVEEAPDEVRIAEPPVKEDKPFVVVEQMPAYPENIMGYLAREIKYPRLAAESGIVGTVVIQFVVDKEGNVSNPVIVKDIGGGCGEEALRVVKKMERWNPGKNRGIPVKVLMSLPVRFTLE
jgi:periplasmic protein TonB